MNTRNICTVLMIIFSCLSALHGHIDKPRVSLIATLSDSEDHIFGFLSDMVNQTIFDQCELIIVDLNASESERYLVKQYAKKFPNIIYKPIDENMNVYAARNMAIKTARSDLIACVHVEDRRKPDSLEQQARALKEHPEIDLVYADFYVTMTANETFDENTHQYIVLPDEFDATSMYKSLVGPQAMWRKTLHERYGYFDESYTVAADFEFWNRAAQAGARYMKIKGRSGLYYLGKTIARDNIKSTVPASEWQRIKKAYGSQWFAPKHYFCTAADSKYFAPLLNLIGSIHATDFEHLGEIAIFDLGLNEDQIALLNKMAKVSVHRIELTHPDLLKQVRVSYRGKTVPGWYAWKFVIFKQALDLFPYAVWVDAGATIMRPLNGLFRHIQQAGYFLCTIGDERLYNQVLHPVKWGSTEYVKKYFDLDKPQRAWVLDKESIAAGVVGFSRKSLDYLIKPLYECTKNLRLFEDDYTAPDGFGMARYEQTVMSVHAYLNGLTVHHQDYTQTVPMQLAVDTVFEELYVTWDGHSVNDRTHIYNSRFEYKNYDACVSSIRYK